MRLLLDTHVVLGQLSGGRALGGHAQGGDRGGGGARIQRRLVRGDRREGGDWQAYGAGRPARALATGVRVHGLSAEHGLAVASVPLHHRDPVDRLLIAQARQDGLTLVTADTRIHAYDVAVLDPLG